MNPLMYLTGGAAFAGALASAILWGLWKSEQAKVATLEANNQTLTNAVTTQQTTIDTLIADATRQREANNALNAKFVQADRDASVARAEIDAYRPTIRVELRQDADHIATLIDDYLNSGLLAIATAFGSQNNAGADSGLSSPNSLGTGDPRDQDPPGH